MRGSDANAPADLVTHYPEIIDDLIKQGRVVGSRVDFARAGVGVAVKAGSPKPDISTPKPSSAPCSPPSRSPMRAPARAASLRRS